MVRAILIICLIVAASVGNITTMDPVAMPVLDVNSLAIVTSDASADSESSKTSAPERPKTEQAAAEQPQAEPATAEPSKEEKAAAEPPKPVTDGQQVVDAAPAPAVVPANAAKVDDPKLESSKPDASKPEAAKSDAAKSDADKPDAAKSDAAAQAKSDTAEKSDPAPARRSARHRSRVASAEAGSQKRKRQYARIRDEEALKNAHAEEATQNAAAPGPAAAPACADGNSLLRAFNLTPACQQ